MILYLDSSALVELIIGSRDTSALIEAVAEADEVLNTVVTLPECACALERARRGGHIGAAAQEAALGELRRAWSDLTLTTVSGSVAQQAATIGTKHGLRGYDAVHLAVAVSAQAVGAVSLASYDRELLEAARREGLATVT